MPKQIVIRLFQTGAEIFCVVKIYRDISEFEPASYPVVTIGTFDGVHIGHRKILESVVQESRQVKGQSVVITFEPHPRIVLQKEDAGMKLLSTTREKCDLFEKMGIDNVVLVHFTPFFAKISASEFIKKYLIAHIGAKKLVIGYDHHFGYDREGNRQSLREFADEFGPQVVEIPAQDVDDTAVSSTKIRNALVKGEIKTANTFLGYTYSLTGEVIAGNRIGNAIGFPTSNIRPESHYKLIPTEGVYAARVRLFEKILHGMVYIGTRPTLELSEHSIEVNIFDFEGDIYGEKLAIEFLEYIRPEAKFDDIEALKSQLFKDREIVSKVLLKYPV